MVFEISFIYKHDNMSSNQYGKIKINEQNIPESNDGLDIVIKSIIERIINNQLVLKYFPKKVEKISNLIISILGVSTIKTSSFDRELFYLYIDASVDDKRIEYYYNGKYGSINK